MPKNSHKDSKVPSTSSALLQPSQIEFVFESITSLLQTIDCELKNTFITIKESIEKQDNKTLLSTLSTLKEQNKILPIIKAFTLYHMLLNIIEELNISGNTEANKLSQALQELNKEGYEMPEILEVLEHLRFYPVFTAHPTESRRRTFLEAHHQMSEKHQGYFRIQ